MSDKKSATYEKYSRFVDENFTKKEVAKLNQVQPLDQFNTEIQDILRVLYDHTDSNMRRLGSIFNAIFTQHNTVFMLSVRILRDLTALDIDRHGLKSCEGIDYNNLIHQCLSCGIFEKIRNQKGKKAALFKLTSPLYLEPLYRIVGKELCEAKEHKFIEWWDSTDGDGNKTERVLTEEEQRIRKRADEIFKRKRT